MSHAIIIGGGIAGLATAVWLSKAGWRITLLERRPILGGRAYTFADAKTGTPVDNGQHLLMGCYAHTLDFLNEIGSLHLLQRQERLAVPLVTETGKAWTFALPAWLPSPSLQFLVALVAARPLPARDRLAMISLGMRLNNWKKKGIPERLKAISVREWLSQMGQSQTAQDRFWDILTYATLNETPEHAHAYGLAVVLVKGLLGTRAESALYFPPETGLGDLYVKPALAYLESRGSSVLCAQDIQSFRIPERQDRQEVGAASVEVTTASARFTGDVLVSAVSPSAYRRLMTRGNYHPVEPLPEETSPIVSINLWFDRPVLPAGERFVGTALRTVHWWFSRPLRGNLFHVIGVASGARHLLQASKQEIIDIALRELGELFPHTKGTPLHSLVNKEREATFALTAHNETRRLTQHTTSPYFYRVGDWTRTGLPATLESAVASARQCVDHILKK